MTSTTTITVSAAAIACVALIGCGSSATTTTSTKAAAAAPGTAAAPFTVPTTTGTATAAPRPKPKPKPRPDPGSLPQTDQLPSADTAGFHAEMAALWKGVQTNSVAPAQAAFFPESAYAQLKRIGDATGDWTGRLVADYALDIGAAHALLGSDPASAQLLQVMVPQSYAHWVGPGVCDNGVGYYEVPNTRVVYRQNGEVRSFGIASMISWRGVWYVVHFGAVLRPGAGGVVDDPSSGAGQPVPSSTC